ncbi:BarA-associated response regulator UvrY (= GacA = SirA) [hydrothermal vent metagenome]|uniref:BarA-associated response regulator UvrY (= GacA = SirA) n=1 Tax=hydrothermal vent metagenome TaxID=652676 RepID=A0A3B1A2P6_9ZZZZ
MIKIMLVDDHDMVRTGLKRLLEDFSDIEVIAEASSGEQAIEILQKLKPDIALMDLSMPGIGGLEATRKLLRAHKDLKIIIVTMHNEDIFPQRLLNIGAMGYVTKEANVHEMVKAIREVMNNKRYISPEIAQHMALANSQDSEKSPFDLLSERELQVMLMLMDGDKVNKISEKLCLSPKTISTYRYRLYDKLNVSNDIELTKLALRHGILGELDGK